LPNRDEHLAKAEYNEKLGMFLAEKTAYQDWAITMLFYASLHYVDAFLALSIEHPKKHGERLGMIWNSGSLRTIYREYKSLKDASENHRYNAAKLGAAEFQSVRPRFEALRTYVRRLLRIT